VGPHAKYTGELLGREEHEIGAVKVYQVKEKYSFAKTVGHFKGPKVGDFITFRSHDGV